MVGSRFQIKIFQFYLILPGLVLMIIYTGLSTIISAQEKGGLQRSECQQMLQHQYELARKDPGNPLLKPLNIDPSQLSGRTATAGEINFCQQRIPRANYNCQMQANNLQELVSCYQKHPLHNNQRPVNPEQPDRKKEDKEDKEAPLELEEGEQVEEERRRPPRTLPQNPLPVNASNCQKGYAHMYSILSKAPDLQKVENRERLLAHWQSQTARSAFQKRCLRDFTAEDMGCILGSQDTEILQACLLVIPE